MTTIATYMNHWKVQLNHRKSETMLMGRKRPTAKYIKFNQSNITYHLPMDNTRSNSHLQTPHHSNNGSGIVQIQQNVPPPEGDSPAKYKERKNSSELHPDPHRQELWTHWTHAQESLKKVLQTLPPNHPNIKENSTSLG